MGAEKEEVGPVRICQREIFSPNAVTICVDCAREGEESGRLYHNYASDPVYFRGMGELLSLMDEFYERIQYPQASIEYRSFIKKAPCRAGEAGRILERKEPVRANGKKGTFVVHVQYRQNATWQGQVTWTERQVTKQFRSALEMLKLIDGALDEGEENQKEQGGSSALRGGGGAHACR